MWNKKLQKGNSLLEVVIAMLVGILIISALVTAVIFSLRNATFAKASAQATKLAQEGIERVRTGRDRNAKIYSMYGTTNDLCNNVTAWDGDDASNSVWQCDIYNNCGSSGDCYFVFTGADSSELRFLTTNTVFPDNAEELPAGCGTSGSGGGCFKRAIILSDDTNYATQKKVTVVVQWFNATGEHQSKLQTVLVNKKSLPAFAPVPTPTPCVPPYCGGPL